MGARDYEKAIYKATGLPDPDAVEAGSHHHLGDWEPRETPAAIDAVVDRRLGRVRAALKAAEALPRPHQDAIAEADFLSYGEYLDTLRRLPDLRRLLERIDDQARRRRHDRAFHPDKTHFYAAITPPDPKQDAFVRGYDVNRHTPDRAGYLAYVQTVAPEVAKFFLDASRPSSPRTTGGCTPTSPAPAAPASRSS